MDYEVEYKRLIRAVTDGDRLHATHFEAWGKQLERTQGYEGSALQRLLQRLAKRLRRIKEEGSEDGQVQG